MIPLLADVALDADYYDGASLGLLIIRVVVGLPLAAKV